MPQLGNRTLDLDLITFSLALAIPSIDFLWTQLIAFACLYTYFFLVPPPIVLKNSGVFQGHFYAT